ncbi:hypothetical protein CRG98_014536 [Punica granatum]|uniref:Uncharacterized protein n=1 Tax=Punica granatum TaxID=22663 RepID=A0A2I0K946_PUNGR|nr:hypothetical protein CRG98_014536 [Punica granatum]
MGVGGAGPKGLTALKESESVGEIVELHRFAEELHDEGRPPGSSDSFFFCSGEEYSELIFRVGVHTISHIVVGVKILYGLLQAEELLEGTRNVPQKFRAIGFISRGSQ